jgi:uncharacterized membrane protein
MARDQYELLIIGVLPQTIRGLSRFFCIRRAINAKNIATGIKKRTNIKVIIFLKKENFKRFIYSGQFILD